MALDPGLAALVVATTGMVGAYGGVLVARRGAAETKASQDLANKVLRDKGSLDQTQQAVDTYIGLVSTLRDEASRMGLIANQIRDDLSDERRNHADDNETYGLIAQRCRQQSAIVIEALDMLQALVVNESARGLIERTRTQITPHPHEPEVPKLPYKEYLPGVLQEAPPN